LSEQIVETCSLDRISKLCAENPNGVLAVFTQESCPYCPPGLKAAKESAVKSKVTVVEAPLEKNDCVDLATKYKVNRTPTMIYFKDGKERARVPIAGKSWGEIKKYLRAHPEKKYRKK